MARSLLITICLIAAASNATAFSFDSSGPWDSVYDKIIEGSSVIESNEDDPDLEILFEVIRNTAIDWRIRIECIRLLAKTGQAKAADFLMNMFYDSFSHSECPAIKSSLAIALGSFPGETRIIDALIAGLEHSEVLVREASAYSLGLIGDLNSLPFLIERLKDESSAVRVNAIRSIARIGGTDIIPYLKTLINEEGDIRLKNEAQRVLAHIK